VSTGNGNKGIHMRAGQLNKAEEFNVTVEPMMFNEKFSGTQIALSIPFHRVNLFVAL
jgi:hypothetical protein